MKLALASAALLMVSLLVPADTWAQTNEAQIQKVVAENEIRNVLDAVDVAVDAKDWEKVRSYYADEVKFDATSLAGGVPMRLNADEMVASWAKILYQDKKSFHMRTNYVISLDGDTASVTSKGHSLNILATKTGSDLWEVWGNYKHTLRREKDGWKIDGLNFVMVYARGNEKAHDYVPED